jgi:hypothetical protein
MLTVGTLSILAEASAGLGLCKGKVEMNSENDLCFFILDLASHSMSSAVCVAACCEALRRKVQLQQTQTSVLVEGKRQVVVDSVEVGQGLVR